MVKLEFVETSLKELCPIALKLAATLCAGQEAVTLHDDNTMVAIPQEVIDKVKTHAGNPGTVEEIVAFLREEPWASGWAKGMCRVAVGEDSPYFQQCVDRMLELLAERIREHNI